MAVVTGASRGIGLAICEALAVAGADVVAVSASINPSGSEVENRVQGAGRSCTAIRADLADPSDLQRLTEHLESLPRPIDVLVNNAGTIIRAPAIEQTDSAWAEVLQVDLTSPFVLAREVGRSMLQRGQGKVIFTASLLSFQGGINVAGYAAAKSGLAGLTRALSNEWASRGINVNAVAPGYITTDNTRALQDDPLRRQAILDRVPAGRWGTPGDIGGAVVFLASQAADYVHGVVLPVDGGWLAR